MPDANILKLNDAAQKQKALTQFPLDPHELYLLYQEGKTTRDEIIALGAWPLLVSLTQFAIQEQRIALDEIDNGEWVRAVLFDLLTNELIKGSLAEEYLDKFQTGLHRSESTAALIVDALARFFLPHTAYMKWESEKFYRELDATTEVARSVPNLTRIFACYVKEQLTCKEIVNMGVWPLMISATGYTDEDKKCALPEQGNALVVQGILFDLLLNGIIKTYHAREYLFKEDGSGRAILDAIAHYELLKIHHDKWKEDFRKIRRKRAYGE